jgi:hypothetical protein
VFYPWHGQIFFSNFPEFGVPEQRRNNSEILISFLSDSCFVAVGLLSALVKQQQNSRKAATKQQAGTKPERRIPAMK